MTRTWTGGSAPFTTPVDYSFRAAEDPAAPLVVYCHGMSEGPDSFARFWPETAALDAHVLAPAGPYPHEVRRDGEVRIGHAWYLYDGGAEPFKSSLERAADWLDSVVDRVERDHGLSPRERVLIGYSQGGYFGYVAALSRQDRYARLVAVAARLKTEFVAGPLEAGGTLRTLVLHGERDPATPVAFSARSEEALRAAGYAVELRVLPGGHGLRADRDAAAAQWLRAEWSGR